MKTRVIILIILAVLLNGLSDARELNELSILSGIGIDVDEEGNYIITTQVLNTQKASQSSGNNSSGSSVIVYETTSKSIHEALRDIIKKSPNKLYIAHLEVVLLSEEVAKENIKDTLDFFLRDHEESNNFMVVVSKENKPQEILKQLSATNSDPCKTIFESIKSTCEYEGSTVDYLLYDSLEMILNDKKELVLASISLDEENDEEEAIQTLANSDKNEKQSSSDENIASKNTFIVTELAYFKDGKFKGYLSKDDAIIYNLLCSKLKKCVLSVNEDKDLLTFDIIKASSNVKPIYENGKYKIKIDVNINATISEEGEDVRKSNNNKFKEYTKEAQNSIKNDINTMLENCEYKYKTDILGLNNLIYKKCNSSYNKLNNINFEKYSSYASFDINVKINFLLEGGNMINGKR